MQAFNTGEEIKNIEADLQSFINEFDRDLENQANRTPYESIKQRFEEMQENQERKTYFLRNSKFVPPSFETVSTDIEDLMDFGRIVDNWEFSEPLITLNTYNFELLEYKQDIKGFTQVEVKGTSLTTWLKLFNILDIY